MVEAHQDTDALSDELLAALDDLPTEHAEPDIDALAHEGRDAKEAVEDVVGTLTGLLHLEEAIHSLQTSNAAAMETILNVIRAEAGPLAERVAALETKIATVFALLEMPPEHMAWLLSVAAQNQASMGATVAHLVEEHMSWDPEDFMFVVTGDIARRCRDLASGRSISPKDVVMAALQFAYDQRNL